MRKENGKMKLALAVIIGALALSMSGPLLAWETGTITGVVSDYADPSIKIAGAVVSTVTGNGSDVSATTDENGVYTMDVEWGQYTLSVASDAIYPVTQTNVEPVMGNTKTVNFSVVRIPSPVLAAADDFNRSDGTDLGSTPTGGYTWVQSAPNGSINSGALYNNANGNNYIYPQGLTVRDFDMSVSVKIEGGGDGTDAILYRKDTLDNPSAPGYTFYMRWGRSRTDDLYLRSGNTTIATVDLGSDPEDWSVFHTVRIRAIGAHHQVWWDGTLVIDVIDWGHTGPGIMQLCNYVGLNASWWDDFSLRSIDPPTATISGTISDLADPSVKIKGAQVVCSSGDSATTDSNGYYQMQAAAPTAQWVMATAVGYVGRTSTGFSVMPGGSVTANVNLAQYVAGDPIMEDTFTRADGALGATEIGGYNWMQTSANSNAVISSGQLLNTEAANYIWPDGFQPSDFDLSMDVRLPSPSGSYSSNWLGIMYRKQVQHNYGAAGYTVHLRQSFGRTDDILVRVGTTTLATVDLGTVPDWSTMHQIRIRVIGSRHMIYWDSAKVAEFSNSSYTQGYFEIVSWLSTPVYIDNIRFNTITEPTGSISGTITAGGSPVEGAVVATNTGKRVTTGPTGEYLLADLPAGAVYGVSAMLEGYRAASSSVETLPQKTVTSDFSLEPLSWFVPAQPSLVDTFTRADNTELGATEVGGYVWRQYPTGNAATYPATISGEQLSIPLGPNYIWPDGYRPADFEAQFTLAMSSNNNNWLALTYRKPYMNLYGAAGYQLFFRGNWAYSETGDVVLRRGTTQIAAADLGEFYDWWAPLPVRVRAVGPHHQVWVNDVLVIDAYDASRLGPGYFQFVSWYPETCLVDDLQSTTISAAQAVSSIAAAKAVPEGTVVSVTGPVVSRQLYSLTDGAASPMAFYVQDADRTAGIRILSDQPVSTGDIVAVTGTIAVRDGECVLLADTVSATPGEAAPTALAAAQRSLGGDVLGLQPGIAGAAGLSNVGLLVKAFGRVTASVNDGTYEGSYFYIDDGSGISDGSGNIGIRCRAAKSASAEGPYVPAMNSYVAVTGALGATTIDGSIVRFLQPSTQDDITGF